MVSLLASSRLWDATSGRRHTTTYTTWFGEAIRGEATFSFCVLFRRLAFIGVRDAVSCITGVSSCCARSNQDDSARAHPHVLSQRRVAPAHATKFGSRSCIPQAGLRSGSISKRSRLNTLRRCIALLRIPDADVIVCFIDEIDESSSGIVVFSD